MYHVQGLLSTPRIPPLPGSQGSGPPTCARPAPKPPLPPLPPSPRGSSDDAGPSSPKTRRTFPITLQSMGWSPTKAAAADTVLPPPGRPPLYPAAGLTGPGKSPFSGRDVEPARSPSASSVESSSSSSSASGSLERRGPVAASAEDLRFPSEWEVRGRLITRAVSAPVVCRGRQSPQEDEDAGRAESPTHGLVIDGAGPSFRDGWPVGDGPPGAAGLPKFRRKSHSLPARRPPPVPEAANGFSFRDARFAKATERCTLPLPVGGSGRHPAPSYGLRTRPEAPRLAGADDAWATPASGSPRAADKGASLLGGASTVAPSSQDPGSGSRRDVEEQYAAALAVWREAMAAWQKQTAEWQRAMEDWRRQLDAEKPEEDGAS